MSVGIRGGTPVTPGFDAAVTWHRLPDMIAQAAETGAMAGWKSSDFVTTDLP